MDDVLSHIQEQVQLEINHIDQWLFLIILKIMVSKSLS
ncbi:unnamed protein product [Trichobilharzia regenti]|nr:unnamed protein product [Trichobilharzia regenti]